MAKIFSRTVSLNADIVDAFCVLQKGFTDQFAYYDKHRSCRYFGFGRCIALPTLDDADFAAAPDAVRTAPSVSLGEGEVADAANTGEAVACAESADGEQRGGSHTLHEVADQPPIFFSFNRFDAENPAPPDELTESFPRLRFMLPEIVLIENERGTMLQVNSLGPVYPGRVARFLKLACAAPPRRRETIPYTLESDSPAAWRTVVGEALAAIRAGRMKKVVPSRRLKVIADRPFSSKDLVVNLIDGPSRGTVLLYRYADVFFCGCTPELLVRKRGSRIESMCLAGTCARGSDDAERERLARTLFADEKNRVEHDYVVRFIREVFDRSCYDVDVPAEPSVLVLDHVQHLHTPACAQMLEGVDLWTMMSDLHPTPATAGSPVGEAKMLLRRIEAFNRGFFAGACGYVDGAGDGEFSVALRTGVFDGEIGYVFAGCGIVEGSDADEEYQETAMKLQTVLTAFEGGS